ncbi:MAG TPA: RHS repeat-associated core domain-containing protein, partial [Polyangiaceae bacterium]|nr:RHS repeat-associated core domain-containing protein [Polyangiaceae bacterium]
PLSYMTGGLTYYYNTDLRGDVVGVNDGVNVNQQINYGPWGNVENLNGWSLDSTRLGWKGHMWEGGITNLYYVHNRWYDPASRGFISEDPIGLAGGVNTYAYGNNDPVGSIDPTGLSEWLPAGCHKAYDQLSYEEGMTVYVIGFWWWECDDGGGGGSTQPPSGPNGPSTPNTSPSLPTKDQNKIRKLCAEALAYSGPGTFFGGGSLSFVYGIGFEGSTGFYAKSNGTYGKYTSLGWAAGFEISAGLSSGVNYGGMEGLSLAGAGSVGIWGGSVSVGSIIIDPDFPNGGHDSFLTPSPSLTLSGSVGISATPVSARVGLEYTHQTQLGSCK